jgi:ubiquinone/menaquinone biosynthesis C-methylase UbiE
MDEIILPAVETINIEAYQNVAEKFSLTRHKIWPSTLRYLESIEDIGQGQGRVQRVLEVGCGNGKNFTQDFAHIEFEGTDVCQNLLKICEDRGFKVRLSDGCYLPYEDNSFDHIFSVAVIHHLSTPKRRDKFISEMVRVCKPGGRIMFQVWATSSPKFKSSGEVEMTTDPNDRYVLFKVDNDHTNRRFYHFFDEDEFKTLVSSHSIDGEHSVEVDNHIFDGIVRK